MRVMMTAMALLVVSVPLTLMRSALADATQEDWDKLGQPHVLEMARCEVKEVDRKLSTSLSAEVIADEAVSACEHYLEPLREVLASEPFSNGPQEIQEVIDDLKAQARSDLAADVEKRRKGD